MSEKNIILTCIWDSDDFIVSDAKTHSSDDEAILVINENTSKITIQIPRHLSLISKKIIERRVQSIAKSGYSVPKTRIRIGAGFEVEITKDEVIPDVLLQEGHKYSLESPAPFTETPSQSMEEKTETEYTPTFLSQEPQFHGTQPPVQSESGVDISQESLTPKTLEKTEDLFDDAENIAGRFIIALTKTGDVYITQKNDQYSVDYSAGRVDFIVRNNDIDILLTKRIPDNDQTLNQAIFAATRKVLP
ncbi:MAG: hypothetical protein ACXADY_08745 [Candidatus Hodarchaeales archaeon]|jgi:hypothetical protein